jgi:hypothetical protein
MCARVAILISYDQKQIILLTFEILVQYGLPLNFNDTSCTTFYTKPSMLSHIRDMNARVYSIAFVRPLCVAANCACNAY